MTTTDFSLTRAIGGLCLLVFLACGAAPARALPSFARQTGLQCNACHTAYPQLNAFGRSFKLNGYSFDGGDSKLPPFAVMLQPSFTHTEKGQPGGAAPHFNDNDNPALSQASLFYGGKIYDTLGAFAQVTYSGVDDVLAIDNVDVRWAGSGEVSDADVTYGVTLNNNPTVEDLWNSTPAWGFPFAGSDLAPGPAAATLIEEALAQQVAGFGGYVMVNDMFYAQVAGYRTLPRDLQSRLGVPPDEEDQISGTMPYWRFAVQQDWGDSNLSLGTFGLWAKTYPGRDRSMGTDRRLDLGLDAQFQYSSSPHDVSLLLRWINEHADYDASFQLGNTDNRNDNLRSLSATLSYLYDQTYGFDLGMMATSGSADATLYGSRTGEPNTRQFVIQLDYLPFNKDGGPDLWPWFNPKFILQYTNYNKFDGSTRNYDGAGRNAKDNNTLYLMGWLMF